MKISLPIATVSEACWCEECDKTESLKQTMVGVPVFGRVRMNLCPICGNKRCPRATSHNNECTGSNEPGQPGSSYPAFNPLAHEQTR